MTIVSNSRVWISDLEYQIEIESATTWYSVDEVCKYRNSTAVVIIVNSLFEIQKIKVVEKALLKEIVFDFLKNYKNSGNKIKILYTKDFKTAKVVYEKMKLLFNL